MKELLKTIIGKTGFIISRKQGFHNNYKWITEHNIKTIIDVGANTGQFATKISKVFPNTIIHSFEPIPEVYEKLVSNTKDLKIKTYPYALGTENGETEINLNEYSPSSSLLDLSNLHKSNFDFALKTRKQKINIRRLDDVIDHTTLEKNILLKIDVQGFEDQVLLGGKNFLKQTKMIICEVSFKELYDDQKLFGDVYNIVRDLGFTYMGNSDQAYNYKTGAIIGADSVFINDHL